MIPVNETKSVPLWVLFAKMAVLIFILLAVWETFQFFHKDNPISKDKTLSNRAGQWMSIQDGEEEFQKGQKPILYDFTAEWCGYCKKMKAEVFDDKAQADWIGQSFILVTVMDRRRETKTNPPEVTELQTRYQIRGFPTLVVRYPNNDSKVHVGYLGRESLIQFLKDALANSTGK